MLSPLYPFTPFLSTSKPLKTQEKNTHTHLQIFMAVEARNLNLFPQQVIPNRDFGNFDQANLYGYNSSSAQMGCGDPLVTTMGDSNFLPFNNQSLVCDNNMMVQPKTSESGLTYNLPVVSRKRSRDSMDQLNSVILPQKTNSVNDFSSVLGDENFSLQMQQNQLEFEHIIVQHTKKIRLELEERQKQQARLLISTIGEGVTKKLREKDEQIQKMARLNFALQERVKSLYLENQLWKDVAQSNEATAMALRCNLEQLLAHVSNDGRFPAGGAAGEAESCCGSNEYGKNGEDEEVTGKRRMLAAAVEEGGSSGGGNRMCKKCGERESCVLLLPCRHLCLCAPCGSTLQSTCPLCNASMNATVHVSMC